MDHSYFIQNTVTFLPLLSPTRLPLKNLMFLKNTLGSSHDMVKESVIPKVTPHNQNEEQKQAKVSGFLG